MRPPPEPGGGGESHSLASRVVDDPEEVNMKDALLSEPIIGVEKNVIDEDGPGALTPSPLPSPRAMTPAQKAVHDLTHLPHNNGCPMCLYAQANFWTLPLT